VSTGLINSLPICSGCLWRVSHGRNRYECRATDTTRQVCVWAFDAGRKYERDYVPFTETAPDDEELYDVMLHETEG
jgi:hypothetical protein